MKINESKQILIDKKSIPAIAVNSMIVGKRDYKEAFELASFTEKKLGIKTFVDLRSCRKSTTDPDNLWVGAHENSSFDAIDEKCIKRAVSLAKKYSMSIIGISVYLGAFSQQDVKYGKKVIEKAIKLTPVAPGNNIIVRIVGGNKKKIINQHCKNVVLSNLQKLAEHACNVEKRYNQQTGLKAKIILGLEIHQGQYPENIGDVAEIYKKLMNYSKDIQDHIGIIEDPANRYISTFGGYLNPSLAARLIQVAGGKIIYYHLKDVQFIDKWKGLENKQLWMEGFQQVGNGTLFEYETNIFEWRLPGEGDINFHECVDAAMIYSNPPHGIIGFSTEHIPASENETAAREIILKYGTMIRRTILKHQNMIGVQTK